MLANRPVACLEERLRLDGPKVAYWQVTVSLSSRTLSLLLALLVAGQAFAQRGSVRVCRYTGKVVVAVADPCACPDERQQESDGPILQDQGCCELRTANVPAVPVLAKAPTPAPNKHVILAWLLPESPWLFADVHRTVDVAARQQAPPSAPLYLSLRNLLL